MGDDNIDDPEHARPRKRTRRACDKCSTSRTRCDGDYPCRRCSEYGYSCHYDREVKKRGRQRSDGHAADDGPTSEPVQATTAKSTADETPYRAYPSPRDRLSIPFISEDSPSSFRPINLTPPAATSPLLAKVQSPRQYSGPYHTDKEPWAGEAATPQTTTPSEGSHGHRLSVNSNNNGRSAIFAYSQPRHEPNTGSGYTADECKYRFLHPLLPYIRGIMTPAVACELLDVFLTDPGNSLFCGASPYILTRIFRKKSVLHPIAPRKTTPALLATILWCVAQTADVMVLQVPGARNKIVSELYGVATALVAERDPDRWRRTHIGLSTEREMAHPTQFGGPTEAPATTAGNEPTGTLDDVLTFTLLSIAVSGGDFKSDCYKWWSKAIRLMTALRLNRHDEQCTSAEMPCTSPICHCHWGLPERTLQEIEKAEERRRVFWLLYSLDRHLSLSFNTALTIVDSICQVYVPLPNLVWENLDMISLTNLPPREYGPPVTATGTEFFEYFLPMMALLGDIIEIHHRWRHPRLGASFDAGSVAQIDATLETYRRSLDSLTVGNMSGRSSYALASTTSDITAIAPTDETTLGLVKAYGTHIYHVLYVLLRGKWDFLSMLDGDGWLSSEYFSECSNHTIMASQSVSAILNLDPELAFMSYLFGIYLLQGSFVLLLFADRMPLVGINESVEQACETIIRAHEVCVVTLSTEFQKAFRKVVRSTLNSVRGQGSINKEEYAARLRALSLYRWTKGGRGLAL